MRRKIFAFLASMLFTKPSKSVILPDSLKAIEKAVKEAEPYEAVCFLSGQDKHYLLEAEEKGKSQATGTLIKREGNIAYILTAAHCLNNKISVMFTTSDGKKMKIYPIIGFVPPKNSDGEIPDDIAILKCFVEEDLKFNVNPMELADFAEYKNKYNEYEASFIGYGRFGVHFQGERINSIRKLGHAKAIEAQDSEDIVHLFIPLDTRIKDHLEQASLAAGDSGGPLLIKQEGKQKIAGVAFSVSKHTGAFYSTSNFVPIRKYQNWIDAVLKGIIKDSTLHATSFQKDVEQPLVLTTKKGEIFKIYRSGEIKGPNNFVRVEDRTLYIGEKTFQEKDFKSLEEFLDHFFEYIRKEDLLESAKLEYDIQEAKDIFIKEAESFMKYKKLGLLSELEIAEIINEARKNFEDLHRMGMQIDDISQEVLDFCIRPVAK